MKTRSSAPVAIEIKAQQFKFVEEIPYDATCYSLFISEKTACENCISKIQNRTGLTKKGKCNKKFRHICKRNKCEQRWSEDCISSISASSGQHVVGQTRAQMTSR